MENPGQYKILIMDEEPMILDLLGQYMSQKGYLVDLEGDGMSGLKKMQTNTYDLIVTDITMPGVSENKIIKYVKNDNRNYTPVIGISGMPWLFKKTPFDAVLVKPFASEELLGIAEDLLSPKEEI